jgi:hypothetical protein
MNSSVSQVQLARKLIEEALSHAGCDVFSHTITIQSGLSGGSSVSLEPPIGCCPIEIVVSQEGDAYLTLGAGTTFEMIEDALRPDTRAWTYFREIVASAVQGRLVEQVRRRGDQITAVHSRLTINERTITNRRWSLRALLPSRTEEHRFSPYCKPV